MLTCAGVFARNRCRFICVLARVCFTEAMHVPALHGEKGVGGGWIERELEAKAERDQDKGRDHGWEREGLWSSGRVEGGGGLGGT